MFSDSESMVSLRSSEAGLLGTLSSFLTNDTLSTVNKRHGLKLKSYHDLYNWSSDPGTADDFWRDAYQFLHIAPNGHDRRIRVVSGAIVSVKSFEMYVLRDLLTEWMVYTGRTWDPTAFPSTQIFS